MNSIIVGFGYRARHGKDTVVKTLIEAYKDKYDIRRYAFADELKKEVNEAAIKCGGFPELLVWLQREVGIPSWVKLDENPDMSDPMCPMGKHRPILQWWGTEYRRSKNPYYWVKKLERTIAEEQPQVALISDMRFKNEFYWVKSFENSGFTIKVERVGYNNPDIKSDHPSEIDLDGVDFDISITAKDGEIEHLKACAIEAFEFIKSTFDIPSDNLDYSIPVTEPVTQ